MRRITYNVFRITKFSDASVIAGVIRNTKYVIPQPEVAP